MLNSYHYSRFCQSEILQTVHRCAQKSLPEIGALRNVLFRGTSFKTPILKKEADDPIFIKSCEGVCSSSSEWDMVTNETFLIDFKVESCDSAESICGGGDAIESILGRRLWDQETEIKYTKAFERIVRQLYSGTRNEAQGFGGLPDMVCYQIDALSSEWNCAKDYHDDIPQDKEDCLYSVYLVNAATSATKEAPGVKWLWANNSTIRPTGERRKEEIIDEKKSAETGKRCTYEGWVQHHRGRVGVGYTCEIDVIEICNVPSFKLDGFFLANVIANASVIFPMNRSYNQIWMHKLVQHNALWAPVQNTMVNAAVRNFGIVDLRDEGFSQKTPIFFDGSKEVPVILSECMPPTGLKAPNGLTQKALFNEVNESC